MHEDVVPGRLGDYVQRTIAVDVDQLDAPGIPVPAVRVCGLAHHGAPPRDVAVDDANAVIHRHNDLCRVVRIKIADGERNATAEVAGNWFRERAIGLLEVDQHGVLELQGEDLEDHDQVFQAIPVDIGDLDGVGLPFCFDHCGQ